MVQENSYTKEAFEIKQMENGYDKSSQKVDEISKSIDNIQSIIQGCSKRELATKLNEWKAFLLKMKTEVAAVHRIFT